MCGRYTLRRALLAKPTFDAALLFEEFSEAPRFNIAPTQAVPIVRLNKGGQRVLAGVRWGLIPHWTKGKPKAQPINARDDSVLSSPMFRQAMQRRRCLVPADGFYEWAGGKPPKVPWFFRLADDGVFAFAGLWERWRPGPDVEPVDTCLHVTTKPNALVAPVHDRMPAILRREDYARWLDRELPAEEAVTLLRPFPAELMDGYTVSTRVNKVQNDGADLVERE